MISVSVSISTYQPQHVQLYMHKEDFQVDHWNYRVRDCARLPREDGSIKPCPAVFVLSEDKVVPMTKEWQFYLVAINIGMELRHVAGILEYHLAFANDTGFGNPNEPKANYIVRSDVLSPPPALDKVRTCARSILTGMDDGTYFYPKMLDGNVFPALKPGRQHPGRVEDVDPSIYLYMPQTHPWFFLEAKNVSADNRLVQWSNGAVYGWTGDGIKRTFLPHVSKTPIKYPLRYMQKLPLGSAQPFPYRT